jgi:oxygen-dependent protoporphyrinogen oxidase
VHITILGGGITGLAAAFYLERQARESGRPIRYTLVEAEDRLGGKIVTHRQAGFVMEGGPDSFITQKPGGLQLARDLGLADELIPCNHHTPSVYLLRRGRLVPLPRGFRLAVPAAWGPFLKSPLVSPLGKLRMGLDWFIPPRRSAEDESLAAFIRRRLGREALDKLAGPLMAGIYVSDPERMSLHSTFPQFAEMERRHRSLLRAMRAARAAGPGSEASAPPLFVSPRAGMAQLVEVLRRRLTGDLRTGDRVTGLQRRPAGGFLVQTAGSAPLETDQVVLTASAAAAAELLRPLDTELASRLHEFRFVSTATVSLAYGAADTAAARWPTGFGFIAPASENRSILAGTFSSSKFDHRAPAGAKLIRVFVGGPGREHLVHLSDAELETLARSELAALFAFRAAPVHVSIHRWPAGNPQYDVGHAGRVAALEQRVAALAGLGKALSGLHLAGSSYHGIGIPDCVESARRAVARILATSKPEVVGV